MKGRTTVDVWTCDLRGQDWECKGTSQKELPVCVVCDRHACKSHREQVEFTASQPHGEPRPNTRETISLHHRTTFTVCSDCRWQLSHAVEKRWPEMIKRFMDVCRDDALMEKSAEEEP
jgi:hypothetical protein